MFLCRKMLIMGVTNEEAARRKKEKEEKEKKKKLKERKIVTAMQKREAKQWKMVYPFYIFILFFFPCPLALFRLCSTSRRPDGPSKQRKGAGGNNDCVFPVIFILFCYENVLGGDVGGN